MRTPLFFATLGLVAAATAQQVPTEPHERAIWDAYQRLRTADSFVFEMRGEENDGRTRTGLRSVLYFRRSNDPRTGQDSRAQVELDVFETPERGTERMTLRLVGDGVNLYRYDLRTREVITTVYGFYGDRAPDNYRNTVKSDAPRMFSQLRAAVPGVTSYLVRLLVEANPAGDEFMARFTSWTPGMYPHSFDEVPMPPRALNGELAEDDTVTDPLTGATIVRGGDRYVFFGFDRPSPDRTVVFDLYDPDLEDGIDEWRLRNVSLALRTPGRAVALTISPQEALVPEGAFVPYQGAGAAAFRPVSRGGR